jgi:hypothetical protein
MQKYKKLSLRSAAITFSLLAQSTGFSIVALAQNASQVKFPYVQKGCIALKEVSTGDTVLRKTITSGAHNTDFAVPTGRSFSSYIVRAIPENDGTYKVVVNLKYSNSSHSSVLSVTRSYNRLKYYSERFVSPTGQQPYQVNLDIGGDNNNVYNLEVLACK